MAMKGSEEYDEDPEGEFLALNEALEPGQSCRVNFRGTSWTATNVGETVISQNTRAKISAFKGLTIEVISNENN
jgi:membrane protein implicated in regulation of membrane protease activity